MNTFFLAILALSISCFEIAFAKDASGKYRRKDWSHWVDKNRNCLNTRHEILKSRSLVPAKLNKKGCKVVSGEWEDYYYAEKITEARKIDIDHLVPLNNAHKTGGASWSRKLKSEFANDPENLVITNRKYNRQKGSKDIESWLPIDPGYACKYIQDWIRIKNKYRLTHSEKELYTIKSIRPKCLTLGINLGVPAK